MIPNITDVTSQQLINWLTPIVDVETFQSREKLIALLAADSPHEELEEEFREFFNGYCVLALIWKIMRKSILGVIKAERCICTLESPSRSG